MTHVMTAVLGYPVTHSLSPTIHNYWIEHYGLQGRFEAIETLPDSLEKTVHHLVAEGYKGFSVTLPHKEKIMELCETVDPVAEKVGAVNAVSVNPDGTLHGFNTDVFGFIENIRQETTEKEAQNGVGFDFAAGPAIVLGAGGAARAVLYGLKQQGVKDIRIINRNPDKAKKLVETFGAETGGFDVYSFEEALDKDGNAKKAILKKANLVVNTTPLGMEGKPPLVFGLKFLPPTATVCDIVYAPLMTELLKDAAQRKNSYVTGIGMLWHQARPAFKSWYGVDPAVTDDLKKTVLPN